MATSEPKFQKRGYLLPSGCKDLIDSLKKSKSAVTTTKFRVNGKIKATQVHVFGTSDGDLGVKEIGDALRLAESESLDLIEVSSDSPIPICVLMDCGRAKYLASKGKLRSK